jgi:hypothetical protein
MLILFTGLGSDVRVVVAAFASVAFVFTFWVEVVVLVAHKAGDVVK